MQNWILVGWKLQVNLLTIQQVYSRPTYLVGVTKNGLEASEMGVGDGT